MNINDFAFTKNNSFSAEFCNSIIQDFELYDKQSKTFEGMSGRGIDYETKRTKDLNIISDPYLDTKYTNEIVTKFNNYLTNDYLAQLPHQDKFSFGQLFHGETFYECLNIQKYKKGEGHYNAWHIETGNFSMSRRMFVFILYLNDVTEGGETELLYSGLKTKPEKGKLLIHPSTFPYVHKGHMPISDDKYILTTWLSFRPV